MFPNRHAPQALVMNGSHAAGEDMGQDGRGVKP